MSLIAASDQYERFNALYNANVKIHLGEETPSTAALRSLSNENLLSIFVNSTQLALQGIVDIFRRHPEIRDTPGYKQIPSEILEIVSPILDATDASDASAEIIEVIEVEHRTNATAVEFDESPPPHPGMDAVKIRELTDLWREWAQWETLNSVSFLNDHETVPQVITKVLGKPPTDTEALFSYCLGGAYVYSLNLAGIEITSPRLHDTDEETFPHRLMFRLLAHLADTGQIQITLSSDKSPGLPDL